MNNIKNLIFIINLSSGIPSEYQFTENFVENFIKAAYAHNKLFTE